MPLNRQSVLGLSPRGVRRLRSREFALGQSLSGWDAGTGEVAFEGLVDMLMRPRRQVPLCLPPHFRKAVREHDGRVLCLPSTYLWNCLFFSASAGKREPSSTVRRARNQARHDFAGNRSIHLRLRRDTDTTVAARHPDYLKASPIFRCLFVQGGGRFFTLWNPDELKKMGDDWAAAKAACEALVGEARK